MLRSGPVQARNLVAEKVAYLLNIAHAQCTDAEMHNAGVYGPICSKFSDISWLFQKSIETIGVGSV